MTLTDEYLQKCADIIEKIKAQQIYCKRPLNGLLKLFWQEEWCIYLAPGIAG